MHKKQKQNLKKPLRRYKLFGNVPEFSSRSMSITKQTPSVQNSIDGVFSCETRYCFFFKKESTNVKRAATKHNTASKIAV